MNRSKFVSGRAFSKVQAGTGLSIACVCIVIYIYALLVSNVVVKCGLCLYAAGLLSYALYRALHSSHFRVCGQVNTIHS